MIHAFTMFRLPPDATSICLRTAGLFRSPAMAQESVQESE